ncbi:type II toxin-antitoxin system VapC family toxin [Rhodopila sp.]|uniref:type II toxin-antitoxin system VapC family toxin n=1 Tax=Rhodopila sp. TaxID=2480087 RepID=UPI003D13C005
MTLATPRGWLIDTNVVSELRKGSRCFAPVRAWADAVPRVACYLSRVNLAEIRFGIERATDPAFRAELEVWVRDGVLPWFGERILEVDERVLLRWRWLVWEGQKTNYTFAQPDVLLAATALVHGLGVVTRNTADFERAGIWLLNPWAPTA